MSMISIQLPPIDAEKTVDVEVRVNGERRAYQYRVELFRWEECRTAEARVECLKRILAGYDRGWELMQIGSPTERDVAITFRKSSRPQQAVIEQ